MRLRAGFGAVCLVLAGCRHLPDGVTVDIDNRAVAVGPCRCALPAGEPGKAGDERPR